VLCNGRATVAVDCSVRLGSVVVVVVRRVTPRPTVARAVLAAAGVHEGCTAGVPRSTDCELNRKPGVPGSTECNSRHVTAAFACVFVVRLAPVPFR